MAFLISHFWPGATEEQYAATVAVIHPPDGLPAGPDHLPLLMSTLLSRRIRM